MSDDIPLQSGLLLQRVCWSFIELRQWLNVLLAAELLRCTSPERTSRCDNPATSIFWVDAAEWYPCCQEHQLSGTQWIGTTHFVPHVVSLPVIADRAQVWLESIASDERAKISTVGYVREG